MGRAIFLAIVVVCMTAGTPARADVITTFGTNFILVQDTLFNRNWSEADSYALSNFGTRLATIDTAAKQIEAETLVSGLAPFAPVWIGYNQFSGFGWTWSDGAPVGFENWGIVSPMIGHTAAYMEAGIGDWQSTSDLNTYGAFLINVADFVPPDPPDDPPVTVPAPGPTAMLGLGLLALSRLRKRDRSPRLRSRK